jgi:putative ABC transport system permease protein
MEKRLPELGIRKAFGATRTVLVRQVVTENFLLTFLGGTVGLTTSYLLVYFLSHWLVPSSILYNITDMSAQLGDAVGVTPAMLFNVRIFIGALLAVLLMNLLSSLVPAYRFTRKNIIDSLFDHYK